MFCSILFFNNNHAAVQNTASDFVHSLSLISTHFEVTLIKRTNKKYNFINKQLISSTLFLSFINFLKKQLSLMDFIICLCRFAT